jgi:hypothetical protein
MEPGPISEVEVIEPARQGRRRRFTAEEKRRSLRKRPARGARWPDSSREGDPQPSGIQSLP